MMMIMKIRGAQSVTATSAATARSDSRVPAHGGGGAAVSSTLLRHDRSFGSSADRHGTTIICVRKGDQVCMMGDGMVSQGSMIVKPNAIKIRRIEGKTSGGGGSSTATGSSSSSNGSDKTAAAEEPLSTTTIVGFAGSTADAFTLLERLEMKLDEFPGQLARSCVELAKGWRTDKYLRRLEASLIVADATVSLELTGNGDVLESHDGVLGVGSGSPYAIAAARALLDQPKMSAEDICRKAMAVAAEMCVYTNTEFLVETIPAKPKATVTTIATAPSDGGKKTKSSNKNNNN
jgi:ATP-dependent HslUV protease, peptidase subunit HslV